MFNHCPPVKLQELVTETINSRRHYVTPEGSYPSITSVLGAFPKPGLVAWRNRVGNEEANKISKKATNRGTKFHSLCETYLKNEDIDKTRYMPDILASFYEFKPLLNSINNIHYLECPLYSNKLMVGGRVDMIAEYQDTLSIIDFKTSLKEKKEEWINDYFLQGCYYSLAYYELTGIFAKQIVIMISVDDAEDQIFIKNVKDYIKPTIEKIKDYYRLYHNA